MGVGREEHRKIGGWLTSLRIGTPLLAANSYNASIQVTGCTASCKRYINAGLYNALWLAVNHLSATLLYRLFGRFVSPADCKRKTFCISCVRPFHAFTCFRNFCVGNDDALRMHVERTNRLLPIRQGGVMSYSTFVCLSVCLSVSQLMYNYWSDLHEIFFQRCIHVHGEEPINLGNHRHPIGSGFGMFWRLLQHCELDIFPQFSSYL